MQSIHQMKRAGDHQYTLSFGRIDSTVSGFNLTGLAST
jgi:hypothetical protein